MEKGTGVTICLRRVRERKWKKHSISFLIIFFGRACLAKYMTRLYMIEGFFFSSYLDTLAIEYI